MQSPKTSTYKVRGLELAYHCWGEAKNPSLVFFHGYLDHGLSFTPLAQQLSDDYHLIALDFRGHGHSGWVGDGGYYHFYDYYHDVIQLFRHLNLDSAHIVGHSMGGSIACTLAAMRPELIKSLILIEGLGPPSESLGDALLRLQRWQKSLSKEKVDGDVEHRRRARSQMDSVEEAAQRLQRTNPRLQQERALDLAQTFTEKIDAGYFWRFDPLHQTPAAKPFRLEEIKEVWKEVKLPVLSLIGEESPFRLPDLEERHAIFQNIVMAFIPEAGHNIHHEQPDALIEKIRAWHQQQP